MILILSRDGDLSTNLVIDWLKYYDHKYLRLNVSDTFNLHFSFDLEREAISFGEKIIPISSIDAVWYRKFGLNWSRVFEDLSIGQVEADALNNEYRVTISALFTLLDGVKWLTNPSKCKLNKFSTLLLAKRSGLNVPKTIILNSTSELSRLVNENKTITKSINDMCFIRKNAGVYSMFTKEVHNNIVDKLPNLFFPSLVQEKITKEFEIRTFYINGELFSAAIFSQLEEDTLLDSRIMSLNKPTRYVPFDIPLFYRDKIISFMDKLGLNCGSLDFIMAKNGMLYFLEVNPVGEFGMLEFFCNYQLHKKVALELIKMDTK